jgi:oligo-1,6-glucosidase
LSGPNTGDWRRWVVYQVYPRSFADSDGDGVGDLRGIISRVDYLHRLGVDVVWLSPVYRSPMDDNGYDISDYTDIDPLFGTLADLDELIAELHARGMKLVMDLVVNHTSDEHPWFIESRSSRDNARRDWYWWRDTPPNWESLFSGPAWTLDETTGQYYLHLFSAKQPDLNWENPEVRQAVYAMMRWWLDRGVDGFRMDVINMISKDTSLPDTTPRPGSRYGPAFQYFICGPRNHEFLLEMYQEVFAGRDAHVLTVGEMPGVTVPEAVLFTDPARHELDMVFQFQHVQLGMGANKFDLRPLHLPDLKAAMADWQLGLAERGWNSLYFGNHDQPRSVSRFGDDGPHRVASAKTLATVLHLHRGTPYVYQGDELAMANAPFTAITDYRDIETLRFYADADRTARRRPARATGRDGQDEPRPGPDPGAVGRVPGRRLHHRHTLAGRQPRPHHGQRGRPGRRPRLGLRALPPADRAASRGSGRHRRRLRAAPAGPPRDLGLSPPHRRGRAPGRSQLLRRRGRRRLAPGSILCWRLDGRPRRPDQPSRR